MKISSYKIFWELRDKYPECSTIIGAIMSYAFTHNDTIDGEYLYLGEYMPNIDFSNEDIKQVFKELGFNDIICMYYPSKICPHLMVKIK